MGLTYVDIKVSNPAFWAAQFEEFKHVLVNTGELYSAIPGRKLRNLGISPRKQVSFKTFDGRILYRDIGSAFIECAGRHIALDVIFAEADDVTVVGVNVLEYLSFNLNPNVKLLIPELPPPLY